MTDLWSFGHDQHSRDEMLRLHPAYQQVVTVSIEDLNMDYPPSLPEGKYDAYLNQIKFKLLEKAQERQRFNFLLSESRTLRCGGNKIVVINTSPHATSYEDQRETVDSSGMAIDFNWRLPRAVKINLPRDIAMAAR
jgi:hypothetical protein